MDIYIHEKNGIFILMYSPAIGRLELDETGWIFQDHYMNT